MITVAELNVEFEKAKEYNKKDLSREKRLKRAETAIDMLLKVSARSGQTFRDFTDRFSVLDYLQDIEDVLAIVKKYKNEYKIHLIVNEDGVDPVEYLSLDWTPGVKPGIKLEVV